MNRRVNRLFAQRHVELSVAAGRRSHDAGSRNIGDTTFHGESSQASYIDHVAARQLGGDNQLHVFVGPVELDRRGFAAQGDDLSIVRQRLGFDCRSW